MVLVGSSGKLYNDDDDKRRQTVADVNDEEMRMASVSVDLLTF